MINAGIVDKKFRLKIIRAVDDEIILAQNRLSGVDGQFFMKYINSNRIIERSDRSPRGGGLPLSDALYGMEDLTLQI